MKKLLALLLGMMMLAAPALAELTVVQETYLPVQMYEGSTYAYYFAEVINDGEEDAAFDEGEVAVLDAAGEEVEVIDLYDCYPFVLAPGQTGWIFGYTSLDGVSAGEVPGYKASIDDDLADDPAPVCLPAEATVTGTVRYDETVYEILITVTNNTGDVFFDALVGYALYDAEGRLLYADEASLYGAGIPAGGTIIVRERVDGGLAETWKQQGAEPAAARAVVFAED